MPVATSLAEFFISVKKGVLSYEKGIYGCENPPRLELYCINLVGN
jgi:hypothetical protein